MNELPRPVILMLEDEAHRIERFQRVVADHFDAMELLHWPTATGFLEALTELPETPALICLDHDLFVDNPGDPDPGDGRDVTTHLATLKPICPVLIHSSNAPAAQSMFFALQDTGWKVDRIAPLGDDWIELDWLLTVRELLGYG